MGRTTSAEFQKAFADVKNLSSAPSQDEQLQLYALAKIAQGEDISSKNPGMFAIREKAMKNAWQAELDKGTTPEDAEKKYVELVKEFQSKYGTK